MKKIILFFFIIFANAEPSAFQAGDLNLNTPYGLTKDEQYIWHNKQDIKKLKQIIQQQQKIIKQQQSDLSKLKIEFLDYKMKIDTALQQLNGMKTLMPNLDTINSEITALKQDLNSTNVVLFKLKDDYEQHKQVSQKSINTIISLIEKLAKRIDRIDKIRTRIDFRSYPEDKIFDKAVIYYKKGAYSKALERFNYLYKHKYKLGATAFYLGDVNYRLGHYKNALAYYKKSIEKTKDTHADYMDDLLYHAGYSFEKIGQKAAAKKSYLKLIHDFPKSIYVKYANKRLKNL